MLPTSSHRLGLYIVLRSSLVFCVCDSWTTAKKTQQLSGEGKTAWPLSLWFLFLGTVLGFGFWILGLGCLVACLYVWQPSVQVKFGVLSTKAQIQSIQSKRASGVDIVSGASSPGHKEYSD